MLRPSRMASLIMPGRVQASSPPPWPVVRPPGRHVILERSEESPRVMQPTQSVFPYSDPVATLLRRAGAGRYPWGPGGAHLRTRSTHNRQGHSPPTPIGTGAGMCAPWSRARETASRPAYLPQPTIPRPSWRDTHGNSVLNIEKPEHRQKGVLDHALCLPMFYRPG